MPNWCTNTFSLKGDPEQLNTLIDRILKIIENQENFFDTFVPLKNKTSSEAELKWGTKGEAFELAQYYSDNKEKAFTVIFLTKWTPPLLFIQKLSKMYNKLSMILIWDEPSELLYGAELYRNGKAQ